MTSRRPDAVRGTMALMPAARTSAARLGVDGSSAVRGSRGVPPASPLTAASTKRCHGLTLPTSGHPNEGQQRFQHLGANTVHRV
ncbi:hypothetical protein D9M72_419730 [compost metagenome]